MGKFGKASLESAADRARRFVYQFGASSSDPGVVFGNIYSKGGWNAREDGAPYSSGKGSDPRNSQSYISFVSEFIIARGVQSVVDIGCGDFRVSHAIMKAVPDHISYVGVDAASDVIAYNEKTFSTEKIRFQVLAPNLDSPAPPGDLYIIREVLQHLSFADIDTLLAGCSQYKYMLITNTVKTGIEPRNLDMRSGPTSRRSLGSGLWPERPPFQLDAQLVFRQDHERDGTELRTMLIAR